MKAWIISISAITILTSIFSLILPESRIGKLIKSIFSILVVFVVISPISNIKNQEVSFDKFVNSSEINFQQNYLDFIADKKTIELENECKKFIEKMGVNNVFVNICYKYNDYKEFTINYAEINLENAVIISDKANINIKEDIIREVSLYLQIDKNLVHLNE